MAPTASAVKRHSEGRKVTHSTTSKSDCMALFREKVQALLPAPRSATRPDEGEFLSRICRTTSDGYVHIIQMERWGPTEAGEEEVLAVVDMEGPQSLFDPPTASKRASSSASTTRRSVRATTKSRTQASSARASTSAPRNAQSPQGADDAEYDPRSKSARSTTKSSAASRSTRTAARARTAASSSAAGTAAPAPTRRSRRAERELDDLCGFLDGLDVVSNAGAASACGSESTRVSGAY